MTLLDDYEAPYKLHGIAVISQMLKTVPPDLLRRTGVGELIFSVRRQFASRPAKKADCPLPQSLKGTLVFLHDPRTPKLLSAAISTIAELVDLLLPARLLSKGEGKQRFDRLCSVLGECIIGSVWIHASRDVSTIRATIDQVPLLVESLGICAVRYLKVNIIRPSPRVCFSDQDKLSHLSSNYSIPSTRRLPGCSECHPKSLTN